MKKCLKIECKCLDYGHLGVLSTNKLTINYTGYTDPTESYFELKIKSFVDIVHDCLVFISGDTEYTVFNTFIAQDKKSKAFQNVYEYNKYLAQKVNHLNAMLDGCR